MRMGPGGLGGLTHGYQGSGGFINPALVGTGPLHAALCTDEIASCLIPSYTSPLQTIGPSQRRVDPGVDPRVLVLPLGVYCSP